MDLDDALVEMLDQRVLVGNHKHSGTPAVDLAEKVYNFKGEGRVDVAGGLVRHNHRGVIHQRARQAHTLAFAARKLCEMCIRDRPKSSCLMASTSNS